MKKANLKSQRGSTNNRPPTSNLKLPQRQQQQHDHANNAAATENNNTTAEYQKGSQFQPMNSLANNARRDDNNGGSLRNTGNAGGNKVANNARGQHYHQQQGQQGYSTLMTGHAANNDNGNHGHTNGHTNGNGHASQALQQQQQQQSHANTTLNRQRQQQLQLQQNDGPSEMAYNQKNHRLAKELSDLRVRHREETKVVSRLTMENMNLASRCREAISQVATLKKELNMYQRRQGEWGQLQREVMLLRRQMTENGNPNKNGVGSDGQQQQQLKLQLHQEKLALASPNMEGSSNSNSSGGIMGEKTGPSSSTSSINPTTDLDRIMSQQFRKQQQGKSATSTTTTSPAVIGNANIETTYSSSGSLGKAYDDTNNKNNNVKTTTTTAVASNTKIPISIGSTSSSAKLSSSNAQKGEDEQDEFDADIDMVDFFAKSQPTSSQSSGLASASSANHLNKSGGGANATNSSASLESTHLASRTKHHARKPNKGMDDHMPGDVVQGKGGAFSSNDGSNSSSPNNNAAQKSSPPATAGNSENNLLSSLDAFEASFASAFPETSFSITSNPTSLSSAKLDMSFDVPDFDPFFKSPNNNNNKDVASASAASTAAGTSGVAASQVNGTGISGKNTSGMKSQIIQDLFPESPMNSFKPSIIASPTFDSDPTMNDFSPMDNRMKGSAASASAGSSSMAPEKLDTAFSRVHVQAKGKSSISTSSASTLDSNNHRPSTQQQSSSSLSPQSMSAEIEQLDAIANLASSSSTTANEKKSELSLKKNHVRSGSDGSGGGGTTSTAATTTVSNPYNRASLRSVRKIKQPVSYAEPSTKSKLRRGDVVFPKVDAADKNNSKTLESSSLLESNALSTRSLKGGGGRTTTMLSTNSPTTDLDRIMGQMPSSSSDVQ
mmetsp:Transcript_20669/g.44913  ORF Transcript_20669/g.44913 Transcript_20669/m.44913 type:complete len:893 (-) Transcript_20669:146-2824(-)|eukprot:CAMPEP_0172322412 /NCGR_PEP_ID=MMETSP1058-20130122/45813_1 /TAXON_ID=83371 /ORGANISM="Detonula confervacea, Strain CCMP 353" /LENGTH=892 /DNA_ID=CAMNT_0013038147 /DNA_START=242 /DNA_END=2920 /DNA_ORIENTATION=-